MTTTVPTLDPTATATTAVTAATAAAEAAEPVDHHSHVLDRLVNALCGAPERPGPRVRDVVVAPGDGAAAATPAPGSLVFRPGDERATYPAGVIPYTGSPNLDAEAEMVLFDQYALTFEPYAGAEFSPVAGARLLVVDDEVDEAEFLRHAHVAHGGGGFAGHLLHPAVFLAGQDGLEARLGAALPWLPRYLDGLRLARRLVGAGIDLAGVRMSGLGGALTHPGPAVVAPPWTQAPLLFTVGGEHRIAGRDGAAVRRLSPDAARLYELRLAGLGAADLGAALGLHADAAAAAVGTLAAHLGGADQLDRLGLGGFDADLC